MRKVAIAGVGYSGVGRNTGLSERHHAAQSALAALADSGISAKDVDGVATWGGDATDFAHMLGFGPQKWFLTVGVAPAFISPAMHAWMAVATGQADTVVAWRIMMQQPSSAAMASGSTGSMMAGMSDYHYNMAFGNFSPTVWAGLMMNRYMHETGATEEDFAKFAVIQRDYASRNPDALLRDPLTAEEYLAKPYINKPLRILDCDYPCDSGSAVIFTTEERARDLKQPVVLVETASHATIHNMNFETLPDMVRTSPVQAAENLWAHTSIKPSDVDTAQLYDGFSFITMNWLEALGLCEPLGAPEFIRNGGTTLSGKVPTNTDGGAINVGRRHGANFCIESVRQLRGQSTSQVKDAEVAVWANAVGPFAGAMLLTKG